MLVAPHPDDESLSCAVALQRAVRAGAAIHIVYATDGENNPWPQRLLERKWRLNHSDRRRWGRSRRKEALDALAELGVSARDVDFLGFPDQGLTDLLLQCRRSTTEILAGIVNEWQPTHLLLPAISDIHPDHNALAVMFRLVWKHLRPLGQPISSLNFVVHGQHHAFLEGAEEVHASATETDAKLAAIARHKTQLKLARGRFLQYAKRPEYFLPVAAADGNFSDDRLCTISRDAGEFRICLRASFKALGCLEPRLLLVGYNPSGDLQSAVLRLPARSSKITLFDGRTRRPLSAVQCHGSLFRGMKITIPPTVFFTDADIFAKVDTRIIFFDQAGWYELSGVDDSHQIISARAAMAEHSRDPLPNVA